MEQVRKKGCWRVVRSWNFLPDSETTPGPLGVLHTLGIVCQKKVAYNNDFTQVYSPRPSPGPAPASLGRVLIGS